MSIITISRGTLSGGRALAAELAERLGYDDIGREELAAEVEFSGVQASLLEAAMEKPPVVRQQLEVEREQYLAAMTMALCRRVMKGNVVYNGHSGHMLLSGIPGILSVRVLANLEYRLHSVQRELGLGHDAAKTYIENVDRHRDRWVRFLYGVDWHDPMHYDVVINLDQVGINAAADMLESAVADLTYRFTPVVESLLNDLYLTNVAHLALLTDPRVSMSDVKVISRDGVVQLICPVNDVEQISAARETLTEIDGITEVRCTIADRVFLLIQQEFDPESAVFVRLLEMARQQQAAVELMYFEPEDHGEAAPMRVKDESGRVILPGQSHTADSSRFLVSEGRAISLPPGLESCLNILEKEGLAGGSSIFFGKLRALVPALQRRARYDMVVLGDLFIDKPHSVQVRLITEAESTFAENLPVPVVSGEEIQTRFQFNVRDLLTLIGSLLMTVLLLGLMFHFKDKLIELAVGIDSTGERALGVAIIIALVPLFAALYSQFTQKLLKIFRVE